MSIESTILLSNITAEAGTGNLAFVYSDKKKGAGYHKRYSNLHTATFDVDSFVGTIKLQATLELYPGEADWFDIAGTTIGGDSSTWTTVQPINFAGNFVWIRAAYNLQDGTINEIRYNH